MKNENVQHTKIIHILISIVIALGIWVFVDNTLGIKADVEIDEIPIEFVGEEALADRGLMKLDDSDTSFSLKLEGLRTVVAQLDPDLVRIRVDLSSVTSVGRQSLSYRVIYPNPANLFSSGLTTVFASSSAISVNIGELNSKQVEIRCDIRGNVAEGYIAGELQFQPQMLEIRGQSAEVDAVSYAKVELDIDNVTATVSEMLDFQLYDKNDQPLTRDNLRFTSEQIQVTLPVNIIKELPLTLNFIESPGSSLSNVDYTLTPQTVIVSGDAALLKSVDSIELDSFDLAAISGETTFNYVIPIPTGCENLSGVARATLKIGFRDLTTNTLVATQFGAENVPEGKLVTVLTGEIPVTLRGTTAAVSAVLPEDLTVIADLSDVASASGSYTVPATVRVATEGDVGIVGTYQIRVNITDEVIQNEEEP